MSFFSVFRRSDEEYIDSILAEVDGKKDGRIYYDEFLQAIKQQNRLLSSSIYGKADTGPTDADEILHQHGIEVPTKINKIPRIPSIGLLRGSHRRASSTSSAGSMGRIRVPSIGSDSNVSASSRPRKVGRGRGESLVQEPEEITLTSPATGSFPAEESPSNRKSVS